MARLILTLLTALLMPSVAMADPISLALSALASTTVAFDALAGMTVAFNTVGFVFRVGLGLALNALQPKDHTNAGARQINVLGSAEPHGMIYGERKVGGVNFYHETTCNNK